MALTKAERQEVITDFGICENDSGSPEVQCALFTSRIAYLTQHMRINGKDFQTQKGLLTLVGKRNRFLKYLKQKSIERYKTLIKRLKLRDKDKKTS